MIKRSYPLKTFAYIFLLMILIISLIGAGLHPNQYSANADNTQVQVPQTVQKIIPNTNQFQTIGRNVENFATNPSESTFDNCKNNLKSNFDNSQPFREFTYISLILIVSIILFIKHIRKSYLYDSY